MEARQVTTCSFCTSSWLLFFSMVVLDFKPAPISLTGLFVIAGSFINPGGTAFSNILIFHYYSLCLDQQITRTLIHTIILDCCFHIVWQKTYFQHISIFIISCTNCQYNDMHSLLLFSDSHKTAHLWNDIFLAFYSFLEKPKCTIKSSRYVKQNSHTQCRLCRKVCRLHQL